MQLKFFTTVVLFAASVCAVPKSLDEEEENQFVVLFANPGKNVTAKRGETVSFSCDIVAENGTPIPAEDETVISVWLKNNLVQMAGSQRITRNPRLSVEGRNLIVADVDEDDAGTYTCQLSSSNQPTLVHRLIVHTPPSVKADKSKIIATAGDDVVLSCSAQGSPKPQITWKIKVNVSLRSFRCSVSGLS
jgi:hypothetical protein